MKNNSYEVNFCLCARADCELSEGGRVERWRRMRKRGNDLCSMHEGLAHFFASAMEKDKCMKFWRAAEKWILLCAEWLSGFDVCRQTATGAEVQQSDCERGLQKMWQTWSLSDLAGEPNTNGVRPPIKVTRMEWCAKMHVRLDNEQTHNNRVWGDEEAVTDDVWGRNKEN
jgi:hypothetical protein